MNTKNISIAFLVSGITMFAVHQISTKAVANRVDDALVQFNILDDLVSIFAISLVLIAIGLVTSAIGLAKTQFVNKKS